MSLLSSWMNRKASNGVLRVEIKGFKGIIREIRKNAPAKEYRAKLLKTALNAVGGVVARTLRQLSPVRSGTMKKSMKHKTKYYKKSDTVVVLVGVKSKFKGNYQGKVVTPTNYAHLVTRGRKAFTQEIKIGRGKSFRAGKILITNNTTRVIVFKRRVGAARANNFFNIAIKSSAAKALATARKRLEKAYAKYALEHELKSG